MLKPFERKKKKKKKKFRKNLNYIATRPSNLHLAVPYSYLSLMIKLFTLILIYIKHQRID